jgi:Glycosyl transferase family 2
MRWLRRRRAPAPAVSIVLATYNRAELLPLALDSALAQDHPNLEVLVMDDGSSDATPELLAGYARRHPPERFRFESHANMGQARTLNRGYELARGEILGYLSDDDLVAPRLVSSLVRALAERPDAVAAYPAYRLIDEAGAVVDTWLPLEYTATTALCRHDTIIGPGGFVRREALEAAGAWDPSYRWMGDLILWMRVGLQGPVLRVAEPLASWRKHPEGATSATGVERAAEHLRLFEHGLSLDRATAERPERRAEALRNACITAAWFAGHTNFASGEPVTMIDQDRPLVSAWASGQAPDAEQFDLSRAERVAARLRELGLRTLELAEARAPVTEKRGGYASAVERLRGVGALGDTRPLDEDRFGPALIEAALDCAIDIPPDGVRYVVPDREQSRVAAAELEQLVGLTLGGQALGPELEAAVEHEIALRREDLERARAASETA